MSIILGYFCCWSSLLNFGFLTILKIILTIFVDLLSFVGKEITISLPKNFMLPQSFAKYSPIVHLYVRSFGASDLLGNSKYGWSLWPVESLKVPAHGCSAPWELNFKLCIHHGMLFTISRSHSIFHARFLLQNEKLCFVFSLSLLYSILWSIVCTDLIPIRHVYLQTSPRGCVVLVCNEVFLWNVFKNFETLQIFKGFMWHFGIKLELFVSEIC